MKHPLTKFLILIAAVIALYFATLFYQDSQIPCATATVQLHPEYITPPKFIPFVDSNGATQYMSRSYYEYPFQMLTSAETLKLASQNFNLQMPLDETITYLKEVVTVEQLEGTNFIDITVKHAPKDQAIRIANAIAEAGAERQKSTEDNEAKRTLEALDEELDDQEQVVKNHRTDLITYLTHYKIPFPPDEKSFLKPNELELKPNLSDDERSLIEHIYTEALHAFTLSREMLNEMKTQQQEARVLLKMPRPPITIHERATLTPSHP